jgi:hypothetical protein
MTIPTTPFGIAAVIALLLPGIIFAAVRTSMQGFQAQDRSISGRIIQALMISLILDAVYLITFGTWLAPDFRIGSNLVITHPVLVGLIALLLAVVFPGICAYVAYGQAVWVTATNGWLRRRIALAAIYLRPHTQYRSVPTAWDWVAAKKGDKWIRVLNSQGRWVGGWFDQDAYFSVYPEPRDLFISIQWRMLPDGTFGTRVENSAGVWVSLENAQVVEWLDGEPEAREGVVHE